MKRSVLLISAFAVFGLLFTQCKKNTEVLPVVPTGEKINVSLNIPNNGGSKTSISDNGTIVWTGNDKIVVCYTEGTTTGVAGILSITNNVNTNVATFTGQITLMGDQTAGDFASYSYDFHYLGSDFSESDITNRDGTYANKYDLDFTNQDGTLAGLSKLHYAMGTGSFKNVNGNWTANLVLENKICVFSYDVTAMVDQTNTYAVDNFYMTFPNTAPNTKLTVGFTGGYTYDDNTKTIYLGKPTKQGENYKLYVILPGYGDDVPNPLLNNVEVKFFSDSHSQNDVITHSPEHFAHNSYNGGLNEGGGYNFNGSIGNCTNMLDKGCARGIFKTASGRLIRFAKGNLKYDASGASLHTTQVEAYLGTNSITGFDHFAFGATGVDGAPLPTSLYDNNPSNWYYTGYNLTGNYDYGRLLDNNDNYTTFSTMRSDDLTNFNVIFTQYRNDSGTGKVPPQNTGQMVLMLTKEVISNTNKYLDDETVAQYEKQYNVIFLLYSGYNSAPSENNTTSWNGEYNYYWLADGENGNIKMFNLAAPSEVEDVDPYYVKGEGYPVRLVHTEFDPNSSNQ